MESRELIPAITACPACGGPNGCALSGAQPSRRCWCEQAADVLPLPPQGPARCYCRACLQQRLAAHQEHQ